MKKLVITIAFVGLAFAVLYPIRGMFPSMTKTPPWLSH